MNVVFRLLVMAALMVTPVLGMQGKVRTGEKAMREAKGSFVVKVAVVESSAIGKEGGVGRMTIDKVISGDLAGTTKGEMLTGVTETTGSMAYVAIETVTGTLEGRSGSFVLMHQATMMKGDPKAGAMQIVVVPGSGTGGLVGISGRFAIQIDAAGGHTYTFEYELP